MIEALFKRHTLETEHSVQARPGETLASYLYRLGEGMYPEEVQQSLIGCYVSVEEMLRAGLASIVASDNMMNTAAARTFDPDYLAELNRWHTQFQTAGKKYHATELLKSAILPIQVDYGNEVCSNFRIARYRLRERANAERLAWESDRRSNFFYIVCAFLYGEGRMDEQLDQLGKENLQSSIVMRAIDQIGHLINMVNKNRVKIAELPRVARCLYPVLGRFGIDNRIVNEVQKLIVYKYQIDVDTWRVGEELFYMPPFIGKEEDSVLDRDMF